LGFGLVQRATTGLCSVTGEPIYQSYLMPPYVCEVLAHYCYSLSRTSCVEMVAKIVVWTITTVPVFKPRRQFERHEPCRRVMRASNHRAIGEPNNNNCGPTNRGVGGGASIRAAQRKQETNRKQAKKKKSNRMEAASVRMAGKQKLVDQKSCRRRGTAKK
jgi:hypothetical protein